MDLTCTLTVDGLDVPGDAAHAAAGDVVALDGLQVRWGRASRLEQPRPATLSARIALPTSTTEAVLERFYPGAPIEVTARQRKVDPVTYRLISEHARKVLAVSRSGARMDFTPGEKQAYGTRPDAWDSIPRLSAGDKATARIQIELPPGSTASLYPLYLSGPWLTGAEYGDRVASISSSGMLNATWTIASEYANKWLGVYITISTSATFEEIVGTWAKHPEPWAQYQTATIRSASLELETVPVYLATVFTGRISDVPVVWDSRLGRPVATVAAVDFIAEMANQRIGGVPWPTESAKARASRIIQASGRTIKMEMDSTVQNRLLKAKDVDSRTPSGELETIAVSTGSVLWPASHATLGEYVKFEDMALRKPLYKLSFDQAGIPTIDPLSLNALELPASSIHRNAQIVRDTMALATIVRIRWNEETHDDEGELSWTQRTEKAIDEQRLKKHGHREISVSTDLVKISDAKALAASTLASAAPGTWTIPEAVLDTSLPGFTEKGALALLDATSRIGKAITLTGAAPWIPGAPRIPAYVDGGQYSYQCGRWLLTLNLTRPAGALSSVRWRDMPQTALWARTTITWDESSTAEI